MKLDLDVQVATRAAGLPQPAAIRRWAREALRGVRRRRVALTVRLVDDPESRALNTRYRGKRRPTNVLSFPFEPPRGLRSETLGDLVICAPQVTREAREQGKRAQAHFAHLVVHGILHLRGYDHKKVRDAVRMERREARALAALGYPDPYV